MLGPRVVPARRPAGAAVLLLQFAKLSPCLPWLTRSPILSLTQPVPATPAPTTPCRWATTTSTTTSPRSPRPGCTRCARSLALPVWGAWTRAPARRLLAPAACRRQDCSTRVLGPLGRTAPAAHAPPPPPLHHPFQLREIAPEYYDSLYAHTSWCWVLWRFIVDPKMGPWSRMHRVLREGTPEANDAFIGSLCKVRCGSRRQRRQWQRWQQRWELRLLLRTGRPGAIPACATTARARQAALLQRRCNATSRCALCCRLPRRLAPPRPRAPLLCSIRAVLLRCRCGDEGAGWAGRRWKQGLTTLVPAVVHLPVPALIPNAP